MNAVVRVILSTLAVLVAANILPGVKVDGLLSAVIVAVLLGAVNLIVRPILVVLTLPVTVLTFGLFLFAINAMMVLLVAWLVPGFHVAGFWWAMLFSLVVSLIGSVLRGLLREEK